jgi:hypothetical protein
MSATSFSSFWAAARVPENAAKVDELIDCRDACAEANYGDREIDPPPIEHPSAVVYSP